MRGYNYDRHYAPGVKTDRFYRDFAASRGMRIVEEDEAKRIIAEGKRSVARARTQDGGGGR